MKKKIDYTHTHAHLKAHNSKKITNGDACSHQNKRTVTKKKTFFSGYTIKKVNWNERKRPRSFVLLCRK